MANPPENTPEEARRIAEQRFGKDAANKIDLTKLEQSPGRVPEHNQEAQEKLRASRSGVQESTNVLDLQKEHTADNQQKTDKLRTQAMLDHEKDLRNELEEKKLAQPAKQDDLSQKAQDRRDNANDPQNTQEKKERIDRLAKRLNQIANSGPEIKPLHEQEKSQEQTTQQKLDQQQEQKQNLRR